MTLIPIDEEEIIKTLKDLYRLDGVIKNYIDIIIISNIAKAIASKFGQEKADWESKEIIVKGLMGSRNKVKSCYIEPIDGLPPEFIGKTVTVRIYKEQK
jgi:hypothetical protein